MPLRLEIKRKLSSRSDRVKSVDFHPTEPWVLACLYNGNVYIWNYENQSLVKTFEITELPVRAGRFVARKNWLITGSDDMQIRVFNYNTHEKITTFEAHSDYIRCIAVHPTQPFMLTSADDMLIKLWDWDKGWKNVQVFEGHNHYVMQVAFNPKDSNTFASASLDRTIKVWNMSSPVPNFTLEGHEKGVNCIDYYQGGEKPYLVSGADDKLVKVWDYQNKTCVQTLEGHVQNISVVNFHPELPIIISGSEDGTVRIWHANTYRLENTLNYGLERVWAMSCIRGSNDVALGYDEGTIVIKLGREEPAVSMDNSGKIIWARHNEIQTININVRTDEEPPADGERLPVPVKELGSCEIYPQTLQHNPNGRFVVVCGDGEYIIYTALAWRNKSFGSALEFVWGADANEYAVRESSSKVKLYKNFKEKRAVKINFSAEGIFGGAVLGIRSGNFLCFYDWENAVMIRRIDVTPKNVFWSETGDLLVIACEGTFYVLRYNREVVDQKIAKASEDEGIEEAFEVMSEHSETVRTGCWTGDCFIYTNTANRLNYFVGGQINTLAVFDKPLYLLGYIPKDNRVYLVDKDLSPVSYYLSLAVLEYQTAILREDFDVAEQLLPKIPNDQRNKIAKFLESQELFEQALAVVTDLEHKFELAVQLKKLDVAFQIASETDSESKWRQLADLALADWKIGLAEDALRKANDFSGLLLLYSATGNAKGIRALAKQAAGSGKLNVSFISCFLLGQVDECIALLVAAKRLPEAAFMARTYAPSRVSEVLALWREDLGKTQKKIADALADPIQYPNLFPDFELALKAEALVKQERATPVSSLAYAEYRDNLARDLLEETRTAGDDFEDAPQDDEEEQDGDDHASQGTPQPSQPQQHQQQHHSKPIAKTSAPVTPTSASTQGDGRAPRRNSIDDGVSSNFSMEVNTTGSNSHRGDDDDLSSFGVNEDDHGGDAGGDEDLDELLNS